MNIITAPYSNNAYLKHVILQYEISIAFKESTCDPGRYCHPNSLIIFDTETAANVTYKFFRDEVTVLPTFENFMLAVHRIQQYVINHPTQTKDPIC